MAQPIKSPIPGPLGRFLTLISLLLLTVPAPATEGPDQLSTILWASSHREMMIKNQHFFQRLMKRYQNGHIQGFELVVADQSSRRLESRWGHAMIRFVDDVGSAGDDITLSFVADVTDQRLSHWGGVRGKYPAYPLLKSLRQFNREYVKDEGRPLLRYIVPSSPAMRRDLIETLKQWWKQIKQGQKQAQEKALALAKEQAMDLGKKIFGKRSFVLKPLRHAAGKAPYAVGLAGMQPSQLSQYRSLPAPLREQFFFQQVLKDRAREAHALAEKYRRKGREVQVLMVNSHLSLIEKIDGNQQIFVLPQALPRDPRSLAQIKEELRARAQEHFGHAQFVLFFSADREGSPHRAVAFALPAGSSGADFVERYPPLKNLPVQPPMVVIEPQPYIVDGPGRYTFFHNNCAGALVNFLIHSGFPHKQAQGLDGTIPLELPNYFTAALLNPYPHLAVDRKRKLFQRLARTVFPEQNLSVAEFSSHLTSKDWPAPQLTKLSRLISPQEAMLILDATDTGQMASPLRKMLRKRAREARGTSYEELYGITTVPATLYQTCASRSCAKKTVGALYDLWDRQSLKQKLEDFRAFTTRNLRMSGRRLFRDGRRGRRLNTPFPGLKKREELVHHLKLLRFLPRNW